jgi:hypothetical protein
MQLVAIKLVVDAVVAIKLLVDAVVIKLVVVILEEFTLDEIKLLIRCSCSN